MRERSVARILAMPRIPANSVLMLGESSSSERNALRAFMGPVDSIEETALNLRPLGLAVSLRPGASPRPRWQTARNLDVEWDSSKPRVGFVMTDDDRMAVVESRIHSFMPPLLSPVTSRPTR